jgi:hypothetical protein
MAGCCGIDGRMMRHSWPSVAVSMAGLSGNMQKVGDAELLDAYNSSTI